MARSKKNRYVKRTLRKKNKKEVKSKKRRSNKVRRNKRTVKKKKINLQIGGSIQPLMGMLHHMIERDVIEYLPTTKLLDVEASKNHYLEMTDYLGLQEIIENDENLKKSPKIRKLFDYDSYQINDKDMYFVYKDFKCENIFKEVDKYYVYILYFYLMECNISRNEKIQLKGGAVENNSDPVEKPDEPTPEAQPPPAPTPDAPAPEAQAPTPVPTPGAPAPAEAPDAPPAPPPVPTPEAQAPTPVAPVPTPEAPVPDAPPAPTPEAPAPTPDALVPTPDATPAPTAEALEVTTDSEPVAESEETPDNEEEGEKELEQEMEEAEKVEIEEPQEEDEEDMEEKIELATDLDLPGFEEYEETRKMLDMKSDVVDGKIKISNSNLLKYKVNWFNVCMGIDIFDMGFENKVSRKLNELGIKPFKRNKYLEKIKLILEDEDMTNEFRTTLHYRLLENCKEPQDYMDTVEDCRDAPTEGLGVSFGMYKKCQEEGMDNNSLLYLHDGYKNILNNNKTIINNVDMTLILLNCDIRQKVLSLHISLELLRKQNEKKMVKSILDNIYEIDKPVIKQVEEELRNKIAQEKIERAKLFNEVNRKQIEERKEQMIKKREPAIISAIMEKMKKENSQGEPIIDTDNVKEFIEKEDKNTDSFIEEEINLLRDQNVAAAAAGGGEEVENEVENEKIVESELLQEDKKNEIDDGFDIFNKETKSSFCKNINNRGIISKGDLHPLLNRCNNF